jgi:integrase
MATRTTSKRPTTIAAAARATDTPEKPYEVRATSPVGLLLRVQPSGARTFYVQVSRGRRIKIGRGDLMTLERAKTRAKAILLDPDAATKKRGDATLADWIENHYREHALAKMKNGKRSIGRVRAIWKSLLDRRIDSIAATDVDKLRNKRRIAGVAPATINRDVSALSGVFAHWSATTKAPHPLADLEPLAVADDERIRYLAPAEAARLRAALEARDNAARKARASANAWRAEREYAQMPAIGVFSDHLSPMVLLSLNSGLRQGELFSLTWEQIDLDRKTLTVLASHSKGNATRTVPLNAEAFAVLQAIRPDDARGLVFRSPVTGARFDNVKKAWAEVTKAAKLPDLRWHDLRHDFASQLVMRGVPLYTVQKLLGHSTPKMTMRYARLAPEQLADAVDKLGTP